MVLPLARTLATKAEETTHSSTGKHVHKAYIALGSNQGDRIAMIERACLEMERAGIRIKRTSSLFQTSPMYVLDQDLFLNGACEVCYESCFKIEAVN